MFLFRDFIEVQIGSLQKFCIIFSYFLIYIVCDFYWLYQIFWDYNIHLKTLNILTLSLNWKFYLQMLKNWAHPVCMYFVLFERKKGCVSFCTCECWYCSIHLTRLKFWNEMKPDVSPQPELLKDNYFFKKEIFSSLKF